MSILDHRDDGTGIDAQLVTYVDDPADTQADNQTDTQIEVITSARQIILSGRVQGVGFRPFVYRLAIKHALVGTVKNAMGTVEILVQGEPQKIDRFLNDIFNNKPAIAKPELLSDKLVDITGLTAFTIEQSELAAENRISVPADLFLCDDCLAELNDPADRRYRYPFINCTQCGPRYTLIKRLPYDRANTTMAGFEMCPACSAEYNDPADRRYHAEPIACPQCGPSLYTGNSDDYKNNNINNIKHIVNIINNGEVVAVKGVGGYHLVCDASSDEAVSRLRDNKQRPHKPLAVMFPSPVDKPFAFVERELELSEYDRRFLLQPSRPVLLVKKKTASDDAVELNAEHPLCGCIAPDLSEVGVMLPYSPLHHLLLDAFNGPLVMTSANISGEPVLTDNDEVERRLAHVADAFLHHDRPIERPADDPVFKVVEGKARPIRIGRGTSPLEVSLPFELAQPVLAVGAHMKNTITLAWQDRAVISPHIGELDSARSFDVFENTITDLQRLYDIEAGIIICDAHPGYSASRWAHKNGMPVHSVLHHHAHASAAYAECRHAVETESDVIAFSWDGVGFGDDASLWGGETFIGKPGEWRRVASMKPFYLPGGDKAGRQPWRSAAAVCWEAGLAYDQHPEKDFLLREAWQKGVNSPRTSSVGRLFDAAAALTGVCVDASYEGQGPMMFEALCRDAEGPVSTLEMKLEISDKILIINWIPLVHLLLDTAYSVAEKSRIFHDVMARCILNQARLFREKHQLSTVLLSGGVFQNKVLTENAVALLSADNFEVCLPELIPVNDAGISFGQVIEYGYTVNRSSDTSS